MKNKLIKIVGIAALLGLSSCEAVISYAVPELIYQMQQRQSLRLNTPVVYRQYYGMPAYNGYSSPQFPRY